MQRDLNRPSARYGVHTYLTTFNHTLLFIPYSIRSKHRLDILSYNFTEEQHLKLGC